MTMEKRNKKKSNLRFQIKFDMTGKYVKVEIETHSSSFVTIFNHLTNFKG